MPFAVAAAGISAAAGIGEGIMSSNAASSAAQTEANAANQATATELGMFNTTQADLQPWMTGGQNGLAALQKALGIGPGTNGQATNPILQMLGIGANGQQTGGGINPATFQASPGYQYQLKQGMNAVTNSAAASGGLGGNALRALQQTGQGLANQNFGNYLGQVNTGYQGLINNLISLSNQGQSAAAGVGNAALATGKQIGSNDIAAGSALASGILGSNNALTGGINSATQNALLGSLLSGAGGSGGGLGSLFGGALSGGGGFTDSGTWD